MPGGLADETLPHLPFAEFSFGVVVTRRRGNARRSAHASSSMASTPSSSTCRANTSPAFRPKFTPMTDAEWRSR